MSKILRIAIVTAAALSAGSSGVFAQNNVRATDNDSRIEQSTSSSASERAARAARAQQIRNQQEMQVQPGGDWNPDGTSPRVDIE